MFLLIFEGHFPTLALSLLTLPPWRLDSLSGDSVLKVPAVAISAITLRRSFKVQSGVTPHDISTLIDIHACGLSWATTSLKLRLPPECFHDF